MPNSILRCSHVVALACVSCIAQSDLSPHFEVASVNSAAEKRFGRFSGGPGSSDPERITYESTTLEILIRNAYKLEPYPFQISGPAWLTTEWYSVTAKLPPGTTVEQYRQMMANLLAERFGLVCHRVMKDFAGYEITVAKGGPKLTPSVSNSDEFAGFWGSRNGNGTMKYKFTRTSMRVLTNRLSIMMRMTAPVVDRTGISGKFDFNLDVETPPRSSDLDDNSSSISDALQSQLGLKLNRVKVPLEVLVIDHAERLPAAN